MPRTVLNLSSQNVRMLFVILLATSGGLLFSFSAQRLRTNKQLDRVVTSIPTRIDEAPAAKASDDNPRIDLSSAPLKQRSSTPSSSQPQPPSTTAASSQTKTTTAGRSNDAVREGGRKEGETTVTIEGDGPLDYGQWLPTREVQGGEGSTYPANPVSSARCVSRGMQPKCLFTNIGVSGNELFFFSDTGTKKKQAGGGSPSSQFPNPIFPADGQKDPLWGHHKYRGHRIRMVGAGGGGGAGPQQLQRCRYWVDCPTVFLFRMSGHSTYHLWENNLGPFYSTLHDGFDLPAGGGKESKRSAFVKSLNDRHQLLIAFVDLKPRHGPKAPHLLDQLLRTFTDRPLLNASRIGLYRRDSESPDVAGQPSFSSSSPPLLERSLVCFKTAVVGISAHSFPHERLLDQMLVNIIGTAPSRPLPEQPVCRFISRNHKSVTRGRKIDNEEEVIQALNATIMKATGKPLLYTHMQDYSYEEQVKMSTETNIMFSPHGGGTANCIWMRKGSIMVEFVAPVGKTLLGMYRSMCSKSGVKHLGFLAEADPQDAKLSPAELNNNARLFSNMHVPVPLIVSKAEEALKAYRANYDRYSGDGAAKKKKKRG